MEVQVLFPAQRKIRPRRINVVATFKSPIYYVAQKEIGEGHVAQLARASLLHREGQEFKSLRAHRVCTV